MGDRKMKVKIPGFLFISVVLFMSFLLPVETPAADFTCKIKGGRQDVYVVVTDYDKDGNPLRVRGENFKGVIKKGQEQRIKSLYGRIRYNYRLYNQSRSHGRNSAYCEGGKIIRLP
jgi:hypothetical protein